MHLTTNSFKKAAKRLAAKHSFALNAAQESLAEAFGFANFDAALSALEPKTPSAETSDGRPTSVGTWMGLPAPRLVDLVCAIALSDVATSAAQQRSEALLRIVVRDVYQRLARRSIVNAAELRESVAMPALEARAWKGDDAVGLTTSNDIRAYLCGMVPGYHAHRYGDQDAAAIEHHTLVSAPLVFAFTRLEAMEGDGALTAEELSRLGELSASARGGNTLARDALRSILERCEYATLTP